MTDIFSTYIEPVLSFILGGGLAAVVSVKYTRKTAQADAMKSVQDVYQETIRDLRSDKDILKTENAEMREQIAILKVTVGQNCKDIRELKNYKCVVADCKNRRKE